MSEEEKTEERVIEERIYLIPLRQAWIGPIKKRAPRAMRIIRSFIIKNMKPEALIISREVNEKVWSQGIEKPPRKIRVRATKNEDRVVRVHLVHGE